MVAACGTAFIQAALAEGLIPVAKHFPGHGRTPVDSHLALPEVDVPAAELERTELLPFRRALAAGCPAVMVAHVRYPALDPEWPASLSAPVITELLREPSGLRRSRAERRSRDGGGEERVGRGRRRGPLPDSGWRSRSRLPGNRHPRGGGRRRRAGAGGGGARVSRRRRGARPARGPQALGRAHALPTGPERHRLCRASRAPRRGPRALRHRRLRGRPARPDRARPGFPDGAYWAGSGAPRMPEADTSQPRPGSQGSGLLFSLPSYTRS